MCLRILIGSMMMRRKVLLLVGILLMGFVFLSKVTITNAVENVNTGNFKEDSSYYLIQFNGETQEIAVNENVTLTLIDWTDESKSTVKGRVDIETESTNQTEEITLNVNNELNELALTEEEVIYYRLVVSESFDFNIVKPLELKNKVTIVSQNSNGTSIEEVETIDEYGTVINNQGLMYYKTDENNQKVLITISEYESLNNKAYNTAAVQSSADNMIVSKESTREATNNISQVSNRPSIVYSTHVESYGWLDFVADGATSGTSGQSKRMEAIKVALQDSVYSGGVTYSTHVQSYGWLNPVSNGEVSGTSGQSKRLEAIKINLTGEIANHFDVYYRVHSQTFGWLGWAKNGQSAGTEGLSKRLEAIEIVLVEKGAAPPGSTEKSFISNPSVVYTTHVETYGWLGLVKDGKTSGTQGESKRLEAIKINLQNTAFTGAITYSTHVQGYGWLNNVSNGQISGTSGQSKRMEAIKISLTGDIAKYFDVYYRVHSQSYGWLGWAKNGMKAGTEGFSKRLEAIQIKIVPKGQGEPVSEKAAFKQPKVVFLDPGHGGTDPGAVAGGYKEAALNFAVAKKVQSLLLSRGYRVYMSRNADTYVSLLDRSQMANDLKADIFVSIHTNSTGSSETTTSGIESYYYEYDPNYPPKINGDMHNNPERIKKSVTLTNLIQGKMVSYTGAKNRGTDGDTFSVVRESAMPATLLEIGFINNTSERQKLITNWYQDKLARAIADGIDQYFKIY